MRLELIRQADDHIDVTEKIECYQHGKTWTCECGQDMWGYLEDESRKCPRCNKINVDRKHSQRESPEVEAGQMTFDNF